MESTGEIIRWSTDEEETETETDNEIDYEIDYEFLDMCFKNNLEYIKKKYNSLLHSRIIDNNLNSPLMISIENNYYNMAVFFLENKLNTLATNCDGNNSLMIA